MVSTTPRKLLLNQDTPLEVQQMYVGEEMLYFDSQNAGHFFQDS